MPQMASIYEEIKERKACHDEIKRQSTLGFFSDGAFTYIPNTYFTLWQNEGDRIRDGFKQFGFDVVEVEQNRFKLTAV